MVRVAAIIASEIVSGPGRQLTALIGALRSRHVDVRPFILQRQDELPPLASYVAEHGVDCTILRDDGPLDIGLMRRTARALDDFRPHLVQTHSYKATSLGLILSRRRLAAPWIAFFHGSTDSGMKDRLFHYVERFCFRAADVVVGVAESQRGMLRKLNRNVAIIPNAVLPVSALPEPGAVDAAKAENRIVIAAVGRLSYEKGLDVLLHALTILPADLNHWHCLIAGDGTERGRLENLAMNLGLGDKIEFLGQVNDIAAFYAAVDLIVMPSRSEGLPNVLLEALFAHRPTIATAVGGVPDVLGVEGAAFIVPPNDPRALADRIAAWLRGELPRIDPIRSSVIERYSVSSRAEAHIRLYQHLLRRK